MRWQKTIPTRPYRNSLGRLCIRTSLDRISLGNTINGEHALAPMITAPGADMEIVFPKVREMAHPDQSFGMMCVRRLSQRLQGLEAISVSSGGNGEMRSILLFEHLHLKGKTDVDLRSLTTGQQICLLVMLLLSCLFSCLIMGVL